MSKPRNQFAGNCYLCKHHVKPGKGYFEMIPQAHRTGSTWMVICTRCDYQRRQPKANSTGHSN